jgi:hypothetical protein
MILIKTTNKCYFRIGGIIRPRIEFEGVNKIVKGFIFSVTYNNVEFVHEDYFNEM